MEPSDENSFSFVLNHIAIDGDLPIEVMPGYHLDRAREKELEHIGAVIFSNPLFLSSAMRYGHDFDDRVGNVALTRETWRYWVVRFTGVDRTDHLQRALNLHPASLELGVTFSYRGASGYRPASLVQFYLDPEQWIAEPAKLDAASFLGIHSVYESILAIRNSHPEIARSIDDFEMLKCLPRASRFASLAHFMVLEAILTHNPHDEWDSLNHQISTKMPLVEKRFATPLDYSAFGSATHEKVWKNLYGYRSKIAHGGVPDFKKLPLKDDKTVIKFMQSAVQSLLLLAVREPALLTDLKAV